MVVFPDDISWYGPKLFLVVCCFSFASVSFCTYAFNLNISCRKIIKASNKVYSIDCITLGCKFENYSWISLYELIGNWNYCLYFYGFINDLIVHWLCIAILYPLHNDCTCRGRAVRASDFHTGGPRFEPRPGSSALGQGALSSLPSLSEETLSRRSRV